MGGEWMCRYMHEVTSERIVSRWGEGECATNNGFVATWVVGG